MKFFNFLVEMAKPTRKFRHKRYFHGTTNEKNALKIMRQGIKPPDLKNIDNYRLKPVSGKVYISDDINYAAMYAMGANMAGSNIPDSIIKTDGRYGYVFEIPGIKLLDIQPDEDNVGELIHDGDPKWLRELAEKELDYELLEEIDEGDYAAWAEGGKIILDLLNDSQLIDLLSYKGNIAHTGKLIPTKVWKFDKLLSPKLNKKNFFELAERIK